MTPPNKIGAANSHSAGQLRRHRFSFIAVASRRHAPAAVAVVRRLHMSGDVCTIHGPRFAWLARWLQRQATTRFVHHRAVRLHHKSHNHSRGHQSFGTAGCHHRQRSCALRVLLEGPFTHSDLAFRVGVVNIECRADGAWRQFLIETK